MEKSETEILEEKLRDAVVRIAMLEGLVREYKNPEAKVDLGSQQHRVVMLIPKSEWRKLRVACSKMGMSAAHMFRITARQLIELAKV